jgi:hypothetical protein
MKQKILIESLAMDLLRVALGLHRGSVKMADRFKQEALERYREINEDPIEDAYLENLLMKMKSVLESKKKDKHEDILMYSILFQNFATHKMNSHS